MPDRSRFPRNVPAACPCCRSRRRRTGRRSEWALTVIAPPASRIVLRLVSRWPLIEIASAPASQSPLTSFCRSESSTWLRALSAPGASSATTRTPGPRDRDGAGLHAEQVDRVEQALGRGVAAQLAVLEPSYLALRGSRAGRDRRRPGCGPRSTWPTSSRRSRSSLTELREVCTAAVTTSTANRAITRAPTTPMRGADDCGLAGPRLRARRRRRSPRRSRAWSGSRAGPSSPAAGSSRWLACVVSGHAQPSARLGARRSRSAISLRTCQA